MQTISYAFFDAVRGVRGKAAEHKILPNDANDDKLRAFLQDKNTYYIKGNKGEAAEEEELAHNFSDFPEYGVKKV